MQEMMVVPSGTDPKKYSTWFELDFTKYPVGTFSGFSDRGVTFNRTTGTSATVIDEGLPAMNFVGDGALSGGTTPDKLLNNDWKITMNLKVKDGTTNPMIFVGRSIQGNGSGAWIANMLSNGYLDWWYNSNRVSAGPALTKGVYHEIIFESINNILTVTIDGSPTINNKTIPNLANGSDFNLMVGGSQDQAMYHCRCFMRSIKIETKKR